MRLAYIQNGFGYALQIHPEITVFHQRKKKSYFIPLSVLDPWPQSRLLSRVSRSSSKVNGLWLCPGQCVPLLVINPTEVPCAGRDVILQMYLIGLEEFCINELFPCLGNVNTTLLWHLRKGYFQIISPVITTSQMTEGPPFSQHIGIFLHHQGLKQSFM